MAAGYEHRPVTKPPDWHGLVAWDMLMNNLATGLFLVAGLAELAAPRLFAPLGSMAYPISLGMLLIDLFLLVLDLGDPWRFHHMLRVFKPSSPMSFGTWSLTAFSLPLTALAAAVLFGIGWLRTLSILLGIVPALASAAYKGVLLSTTAQPGWKEARWMGGYLGSSAPALGCAVLLALAVARDPEAAAILRLGLAMALVLNLAFLALLAAGLRKHLPAGAASRAAFLAGLAAPLVLLAVGGPTATLGAVAVLVLTALAIRYRIVHLPQE